MTSHELARLLLSKPDVPVATHANNHDANPYGGETIKVGLLNTGHVCIGNISKRNLNKPGWYITEMWHGDAPEEWGR